MADLDGGDAASAATKLEDYLSTGACKEGSIGVPDLLKRKADGTFDLGLALFRIGEQFGRRFGEEEIDAGVDEGMRAQRHAQNRVRPAGHRSDRGRRLRAATSCARAHAISPATSPSSTASTRTPCERTTARSCSRRASSTPGIRSGATRRGTAPSRCDDRGQEGRRRGRRAGRVAGRLAGRLAGRVSEGGKDASPEAGQDGGKDSGGNEGGGESGAPEGGANAGSDGARRPRTRRTAGPSPRPGAAAAHDERGRADARSAGERPDAPARGGEARRQEARAWDGGQMKLLLLALAATVALILAGPSRAWAQGAPQLQVQADQDTVGVGDILHLELTADSADAMPTESPAWRDAGVQRARREPSTRVNLGGNRGGRFGLTVDWALQAQRVGVFTVVGHGRPWEPVFTSV